MNRKLKLWELNRPTVEEFKSADKFPLILILDNIRSLSNVGTFFRTADAFNVEKIYICGITAQPPHREIQKTALGATDSVEWEYVENINIINIIKNIIDKISNIVCSIYNILLKKLKFNYISQFIDSNNLFLK
jgi:tRNA G18 (ribose-2'-O)-methylase SpoU